MALNNVPEGIDAGLLKKYAMEQFHEMRRAAAAHAVAAGARGVDIAMVAAVSVVAARVHLESLLAFCAEEGEAEFGKSANRFGEELAAEALPKVMADYKQKAGHAPPPKTELPN